MYYIGLDVHKKTISYCVKDAAGHVHRDVVFLIIPQTTGLTAARARGRKGGRPVKLSPKGNKDHPALLKTADLPVAEIAAASA